MADRMKAWLYRLLGQRSYLSLISRLFFLAYRTGLLRTSPEYACHYYVRDLVEPGDCVLDIGANLGYYSVLFAEWVGDEGQVYSVEPVPIFREVLGQNVRSFPQVDVIPYALGDVPATVQMGLPESAGPHRHGHTQILSDADEARRPETFEAEVRTPEDLFGDLPRLDYVKCDVEGHEGVVLPAMEALLREHRPIVQVEVAENNRASIYELMEGLGYQVYYVRDGECVAVQAPTDDTQGDWIFQPPAS